MFALPPDDSPIWKRLEEDVADEHWPVPTLFGWLGFWYRGPRNELHRRAAYLHVRELLASWASFFKRRKLLWLRLIFLLFWVAYTFWLELGRYRIHRSHLYFVGTGFVLAIPLYSLVRVLWFTQSARRYFGGLAPSSVQPG